MTEYWKSNPMHWCELCRCWMNDTKAARLNHERGTKHQEALQKKLRDMGKKADAEKQEEEAAVAAMGAIEAAAAKQYAADQESAHLAAGMWVFHEASGYHYNAVHRWYYDTKTSFYYGGQPPAWTQTPPLPSVALWRAGQAAAAAEGAAPGGAAASSSGRGGGGAAAAAASALPPGAKVVKKVVQLPAHPAQLIGGHAVPTEGRIGGAKGVGSSADAAAERKRPGGAAGARAGGKREADPAEAEALARREAARKRVEARTKAGFGFT